MSQVICHHKGRYNFYCTISDGFMFVSSLTLVQLTAVIKEEYGANGLEKLPKRLERAKKRGHSFISSETLGEFLCCNRAGENEARLSTQACIDRFLS